MQIVGRAAAFAKFPALNKRRARSIAKATPKQTLSKSIVLALAVWALVGLTTPSRAQQHAANADGYPSETYSELMSYVQQLGEEEPILASAPGSPHNFTPVDADAYSALRSFVSDIG